jgi:hypothetical protein
MEQIVDATGAMLLEWVATRVPTHEDLCRSKKALIRFNIGIIADARTRFSVSCGLVEGLEVPSVRIGKGR